MVRFCRTAIFCISDKMVDRIVMIGEIPVLIAVQLSDVRPVSQGLSGLMVNAADSPRASTRGYRRGHSGSCSLTVIACVERCNDVGCRSRHVFVPGEIAEMRPRSREPIA